MARIRDDFPEIDINQSTFNDAMKQCATDERTMKEMFVQEERDSRIKELQSQFTAIPRNVIIEILSSVKWDVEAAILPLFNILDKYQKVEAEELKKQVDLRQSQMPRPDDKIKIETVEPKVEESPFKEDAVVPVSNETKQTVKLAISATHVDVKNPITVSWELTSGQSSPYDWIGLYKTDQSNKNYITYQYRGPNPNGSSLSFTSPSAFGTYEFRYLPYGSYQHIAISNPITVGPKIQLQAKQQQQVIIINWSAEISNYYSTAWIGIFSTGNTHKNWIHWEYAKSPEIILPSPVRPGSYEVRYFVYGYEHVATSNQIQIEGQDEIQVEKKEGSVRVKVRIVSVNPWEESVWIGMYEKNDQENKKLKRYKYVKDHDLSMDFSVPDVNEEYEFRVFKKNYELMIKSDSFVLNK